LIRKRATLPETPLGTTLSEMRPRLPESSAGSSMWLVKALLPVAVLASVAGCKPQPPAVCSEPDASIRPVISAASYDQSCKIDSDCVGVGQGDACNPCSWCTSAAINAGALARYQADVDKSPAGWMFSGSSSGQTCFCPGVSGPYCCAGKCSVAIEGCSVAAPDAGEDAGADAKETLVPPDAARD